MKFTNGYWLLRPEFTPDYVREIYEGGEEKGALRFYGPYRKINHRGDTLNIGQMTYTVTAPMENVIQVHMQNHMGNYVHNPQFQIVQSGNVGKIEIEGNRFSITAGSLTLKAVKGEPGIQFLASNEKLSYSGAKDTAMMHHKDGKNYLVTALSLDVGELVYGLGERFTPFVKNGQSIDIWNEDGGTASEISYKNIPFYLTNRGYGVFVNHPGKVSFEVGSEKVERVQFSVEDEEMEYFFIYGPTPKEIISRYTALTGRPPIPPKWSFGLWLTTSFTTDYSEETVNRFIDGMAQREIPLHVFHFDCFWMKGFEWCNFEWDKEMFPDPKGMLCRLHQKGLKICVWINPYIAQQSPLFKEGMEKGFLIKRVDGRVWQWDMWQAGMALVDFTNPQACRWYQGKLKTLLDMGVDCFKTDFGERIPVDVRYYDGSDPEKMHNYYTYLYNECVYELLKQEKGEGEAVLFARSATVGGQKFPVHWGGDSTSQYVSMAETLRGGLSLMDSGFAFWSHDIGGFEDNGSADLYKRWVAFGLLSSHSRLHGSSSYRVPWNYDEEACRILQRFTHLKCRLMPYLYTAAVQAHRTGIPVMRPMHMEFPDDANCAYLDRQYMLGDSLLVAPVFREDGWNSCYLPQGTWNHLLTGEQVQGGRWYTGHYDYDSLPLFVRENTILPIGSREDTPDYEYTQQTEYWVYQVQEETEYRQLDSQGLESAALRVSREGEKYSFVYDGTGDYTVMMKGKENVKGYKGCYVQQAGPDVRIIPILNTFSIW